MTMKEEKFWFRHWLLRFSSTGVTTILFFLLGLRMKLLVPSENTWVIFLILGSLMGLWFLFRFFSVITMNSLVNRVYIREFTYEDLFSYEMSKQRFVKVLQLTLCSAALFIILNTTFIIHQKFIAIILLIFQAIGAIWLSYQHASKKLQLVKTSEAIEQIRFSKHSLH